MKTPDQKEIHKAIGFLMNAFNASEFEDRSDEIDRSWESVAYHVVEYSNKLIPIQKFMDDHLEWAVTTFGNTPPAAPLHHLLKEIDKELIPELSPSPKDDRIFDKDHFEHVKEEFADCFILLFHAAKKYGLSAEEIFAAMQVKFEKNKKRKWGPVDENGVSNHIKES
jgi:NTP pyrophosphatase (non-canonical NTP hydrolase)